MKQIYLDSDDEITAIISKLESFNGETVALVPPKRSTVLQSVVNLKLLKKASDSSDVKLVLITRDVGILNIASQLDMLCSPGLDTEPAVPEPMNRPKELPSDRIDGSQPSESDLSSADKAVDEVKKPPREKKGDKKSGKRVPDFDRFKKWLFIGLAALLLLGGAVWAIFNLLPGADVTIQARTQDTTVDFTMQLDPNADDSDIEAAVLAAESRQLGRTLTTTFEATGERTVGERASGSVTVTNCESSAPITIASGTALTAANGRVFRATSTVSVPGSSAGPGFTCANDGQASVPVEADNIGPEYNLGPTSYRVEGYSSSNVGGQGGNMSGGSQEQVSVITDSDVDTARSELLEEERSNVEEELKQQFGSEHYVVEESFRVNVNSATSEPAVGEESDTGRLILQVSYTMLAVSREEFEQLLEFRHLSDVDDNAGLATIESGLDEVEISALDTELWYGVQTAGVVGPDIGMDELGEEISGMSYGDAIDHIESMANITSVQIDLSPFWSSRLPNDPDRINIEFDIDGLDADDSSD